jgi:ATP-dependent Lon protease
MEIIHIAGYTHNEKRHILDKYLMPEAVNHAGLMNGNVKYSFTETVKDYIIQNYCREPGVRSLKKFTNRITEKIAYEMVENNPVEEIVIDVTNIEKYIGHPLYRSNKFYGVLPPAVSLI